MPCSTWEELRQHLLKRFSPINKVKSARDRLAVCRQNNSVSQFNEEFQKIIMDIPNISPEEAIDRYLRGLKRQIQTELCTKEYENLNDILSDALKVEASKGSFAAGNLRTSFAPQKSAGSATPVPMDLSNLTTNRAARKAQDMRDNSCFYCHQKGCRIATCPIKAVADAGSSRRNIKPASNHRVSNAEVRFEAAPPTQPEKENPTQGA